MCCEVVNVTEHTNCTCSSWSTSLPLVKSVEIFVLVFLFTTATYQMSGHLHYSRKQCNSRTSIPAGGFHNL